MTSNRNSVMAKYRHSLPQLGSDLFITDGGIETTLIFHNGFELPEFAAFDVLRLNEGYHALTAYYNKYATIAQKYGTGFILESATWRASLDWGQKIGYTAQELVKINHQAIDMLARIRDSFEDPNLKIVISGCIGPRGDGYYPEYMMSSAEAERYHRIQIKTLADTQADMISALTMTYKEEAVGIVRAAQSANMPVVISFTVETDGRLPSGQALKEAIHEVDVATNCGPVYYMINCAHPRHFENIISINEPWTQRIRGIRANASSLSHAELDQAEELDDGNPSELGLLYQGLKEKLINLNILGGCCGTDHRHIEEICMACIPKFVI